MDPISLAIGAVGLGMQVYGMFKGSSDAHDAADKSAASAAAMSKVSIDQANQEQSINDQKQQAMELSGRRQQLEIVRNQQRARALAENTATGQGAQFGSGLQGGLAQITDQSTFNMSGVNSALQTGRNIAGFNQNITNDRIQMSQLQATASANAAQAQANQTTDQGWSSLGGSLMKSGPVIGGMMKGMGGGTSGNYSGTPGASNTGGWY